MAKGLKYPQEFHERAVRLAREADRPVSEVARDLGVHPKTLRGWIRQEEATHASSRTGRLATEEREELVALRREVRDLRRANEILKAASVFFARELDQPRPR